MQSLRELASNTFLSLPYAERTSAFLGLRSSRILPAFRVQEDVDLIELVLRIDSIATGRYLYSKLYYLTTPGERFSESSAICFELARTGVDEVVQIELPEAVSRQARASGYLKLRVDGLPNVEGKWSLGSCRLVSRKRNPQLAARARRRAHRQWVREQVLKSEAEHLVDLPHYPESLSLELTPVCNLACPHCSSHGKPHLHRHHNTLREMPIELLDRLADEAFPHASVISLVGRGEPTVASDALWQRLVDLLRQHELKLSCVTNGTAKRDRFNAELLPWIHELVFSIDGASEETFSTNRKGAQLSTVMENLGRYHTLRTGLGLARRPQLTVSWTLKANNLAELPDFIDLIRPYEPDLLSIRHMVVFQDDERHQSLLDDPDRTNDYLRRAYEKLDSYGIRHESPPLTATADAVSQDAGENSPQDPAPTPDGECNWMHRTAIIMADGEVTSCGKHYSARVGQLDDRTTLWQVWNGPAMHSLRATYGTPAMWLQCQQCWLREIKWHAQRQAKDRAQPYRVVDERMAFSNNAWDYRNYSEL